jgi:hypothetical protein
MCNQERANQLITEEKDFGAEEYSDIQLPLSDSQIHLTLWAEKRERCYHAGK